MAHNERAAAGLAAILLRDFMTDHDVSLPDAPGNPPGHPETTQELLHRVRGGDREALDRLMGRYLGPLRRWARGRLPSSARSLLSTDDLVQDTLLKTLSRVDDIESRGPGTFQAYLRRALVNKLRDAIRDARRDPAGEPLDDGHVDPGPSPLEEAVGRETFARYEAALERLRVEDRAAIIARVEMRLPWIEVKEALEKPSVEAAQMAVSRALVRLAKEYRHER